MKTVSEKPIRRSGFLRTIFVECYKDDVLGHAAQLAFYFLFALFPTLIFLTALVAYLPIPRLLERLMGYLSDVIPTVAFILVQQTMSEITRKQRGGLLSLGLIITVWAASSGVHALINSLNVAYGIKTTRPWWKDRLLAIILTFVFSALTIAALAIIFFGGNLGVLLANHYQLARSFVNGWQFLQWPLLVFFVLLGLELIYYFAPNIKQRWQWLSPGAIFALFLWLAISFGFKWYVIRVANYSLTYGSLGSVMVLMLWLYLTSIAILVGGEINSIIALRKEHLKTS